MAWDGTLDWDAYWRGEVDGGPMDAGASTDKVRYLERFFDDWGVPGSFASVGCGDGTVPAFVATEYPEVDAWGFDVSESVVVRNRERYASLESVAFEVASLPNPAIDRAFEFVYCYATLPYVRDVERAVRDLYELVEPGGCLVLHYPNPELCETYADGITEGTPLYRRFELVCERENELTRDRIETLLNTDVRDYWERVDAPDDVHGTLTWMPCVYAEKPQS